MLIWHKNFFFAKLEYGYQKNAQFYADFETVEKNVKNLLTKKLQPKKCEKSEVLLFYTTNLQKCLANNFFWVDFFRLFPQIWNQRKILRILNTHMSKKNKFFGVIEYIYENMLELVECKFARNGLTNWKTFLTNIFKNIIWHLFVGESYQVLKITVTYWTIIPTRIYPREPAF